MSAFKSFDKTDWYGLAGAEPFADGSEPLVNYGLKVDGLDAMSIVDANGFHMEIYSPEGDVVGVATEVEAVAVYRFLATLKAEYETGELQDMGITFERDN